MSTRSGKRIRGSDNENTINADKENVVKSKRKKSKRLKENSGEVNISFKKKRKDNYVTYPTGEVVESDATVTTENSDKPTKKPRKNALKEHDINITKQFDIEHFDSDIDTKKPIRVTRRTRKFTENNAEDTTVNKAENNENTINADEENVVKSERKKSKHLKDNCGEVNISFKKMKLKDNYVTYPMDDEIVESDATVTTENSDKPTKTPPKNALKEHDINITMQFDIEHFDSDIDTKKPIRVTRHTRKFTENNAEDTTVNKEENIVMNEVVTNGNIKKSKKKDKHKITEKDSEEVPKFISKKSTKQKKKNVKRTSLKIVEDIQPEKSILDKSNTDVDSFHSAAGNPENGENNIEHAPKLVKSPEVSPKMNTTFDKNIQNSKTMSPKRTPDAIEIHENRSDRFTIINNSMNQLSGMGNNKKKGQVINKHSLDRLNVTSDTTSEMNNVSYDKVDHNSFVKTDKLNTTFEKQHRYEKSQYMTSSPSKDIPSTSLNSTLEIVPITRVSEIKPINTTYEKEGSLNTVNTTFDKTETQKHNSGAGKLSLISLDSSKDKSVKNSQITNTNDQLITENLINTTPDLIKRSIDSLFSNDTSKLLRTPSPKNLVAELLPRMTKVMFCSPLNNPIIATDKKMKEIKSSLKGSNKPFVFGIEESSPAMGRKRSRTQGDTDTAAANRKRLAADMHQQAVDRLNRPRSSSANARLVQSTTPSKKTMTPFKPKTAKNRPARSKIPNFTAFHQRQFQKMEFLDDWQEWKAKRAKQLLPPLGSLAVLEKISPKIPASDAGIGKDTTKKSVTPKKTTHPINANKATTTNLIKSGYTRFGFKLNQDINLFSIPSKTQEVHKLVGLKREETLPSSTGVTSSRKEIAKQTIMRKKSFASLSDKRKENRTIIKGVRINKRFELQMKMRNGDR